MKTKLMALCLGLMVVLSATAAVAADTTPPVEAKVIVTKPAGGEAFIVGSSQVIQWSAKDIKVDTWEILCSEDGGKTYGTQLALLDAKEFKDSWSWKVTCEPGSGKRIKVAAHSALAIVSPSGESGVFSVTIGAQAVENPGHPQIERGVSPKTEPTEVLPITPPRPAPGKDINPLDGEAAAPIRVLSPNGGEQLSVGDKVMIKWSMNTNPAPSYSIMFRAAPAKAWKPLLEDVSILVQEWEWAVKEKPTKECYIRVIAKYADHEVYDDCDAPFSIVASTKAKPKEVQDK